MPNLESHLGTASKSHTSYPWSPGSRMMALKVTAMDGRTEKTQRPSDTHVPAPSSNCRTRAQLKWVSLRRETPRDAAHSQKLLNRAPTTVFVLATSEVCTWGWGVSKEQPLAVCMSD